MPTTTPYTWQSKVMTHVGKIRSHNEDAWLEQGSIGLWVVADGMGGHTSGELASGMIVDRLRDVHADGSLSSFVNAVEAGILAANHELVELSSQTGKTIGSTVVALLLHGRHGVCMWAGDSRAYRYRNGELAQLTTDHSEVERYIQMGLLARADAAQHPAAHMLTRAVGVDEPLFIEMDVAELADGDRFLLCSDGLDRHVNDEEIRRALARGSPAEVVGLLIDLTLARGAIDNVTVGVIDVRAAGH